MASYCGPVLAHGPQVEYHCCTATTQISQTTLCVSFEAAVRMCLYHSCCLPCLATVWKLPHKCEITYFMMVTVFVLVVVSLHFLVLDLLYNEKSLFWWQNQRWTLMCLQVTLMVMQREWFKGVLRKQSGMETAGSAV